MKHFKIVFFCLFCSVILMTSAQAQVVEVVTFEKGLSSDAQVLDVRTSEEFNAGHLKDAMLADWKEKEEFARRIEALDKKKPVYVYCLSGGRSASAAEFLKEQGFKVTELKGGINAWKQADKPLEGAKATEQISTKSYDAMLHSSPLVLVNFGATWCPPCRKMAPVLKAIKEENPEVSLIDIDAGSQTALMKAHQVLEMPTYILYKEGQEVWRTTGLTEKTVLSAALAKFH